MNTCGTIKTTTAANETTQIAPHAHQRPKCIQRFKQLQSVSHYLPLSINSSIQTPNKPQERKIKDLGKIRVETVKFQFLKTADGYEIRRYPPCVVAQVTYDPSQTGGNKDSGFSVLTSYIGASYISALARPQNTKPEKIAMTAPVITSTGSEKIAMTAPVYTGEAADERSTMVTMQFVLPSKYTKAEDAPKPTDERVVIKEVGEKICGVVRFAGAATDSVVEKKVEILKGLLEKDGCKVIGDFVLGRYNPPWTLPPFRTNEVMIPVQLVENN